MELATRCVFRRVEIGGSGFGKGFGLGGGDGDGEWSGIIGVVGIFSVDSGSLNSGGELVGSSENRLSITWLIAKISSWLSSSASLAGSLDGKGFETYARVNDEVWLATILDVLSGFLKNMDLIVPIDLGFWGIWSIC